MSSCRARPIQIRPQFDLLDPILDPIEGRAPVLVSLAPRPVSPAETARILLARLLPCLGLVLALTLTGCDEDGDDPSGSPATPAAVAAIDLDPGQTSVRLGWTASVGPVEQYLVLQARNGGSWTFLDQVDEPSVVVRGKADDEVQILAIAAGRNGTSSPPSPPSPILRFRPAPPAAASPPAAAVAVRRGGGGPTVSRSRASTAAPGPERSGLEPAGARRADEPTRPTPGDSDPREAPEVSEAGAEEPPATTSASGRLSTAARARLLRARPRWVLPTLSDRAARWLEARVDEHGVAGVRLVGAGLGDADEMSELVWRDAAGQIFVSDGAATAAGEGGALELEETVRLRPTERLAGLADVDGDGTGDWLIEETSGGEIWIVDGATGETRAARERAETEIRPARLAAHADLDGDGRAELLWRDREGSLFLSGAEPRLSEERIEPLAGAPSESLSLPIPPMPAEALLSVADLDGDGVDDFVTRDRDGRLELVFTVWNEAKETGGARTIRFATVAGAERPTEGLDLLAALDLDGDGRAELAWLNGDAVELWDPQLGPIEGFLLDGSAPGPTP
ncbi:MAG: FG-GAP repeat domain-containing protein [bacterium]